MWPFRRSSRWRRVDDGFFVTRQVRVEDLPAIAKAGFRTLVCVRLDGEQAGQPAYATIAAEAARLGLASHHIPVCGMPDPGQIAAMRKLMDGTEGPVLGWCSSGARAKALHRMSKG